MAPGETPASEPSSAEPRPGRHGAFADELEKVGGRVIPTTSANVSRAIVEFLRGRGLNQVQVAPGVVDERLLTERGITAHAGLDPLTSVGITWAICGIADTGSVVVVDGPGEPLQASLVPEIHVAIVSNARVVPTLSDALSMPEVREAAAAVVITGPSRTGDIEMTHTIGVHGPRELIVFLVE